MKHFEIYVFNIDVLAKNLACIQKDVVVAYTIIGLGLDE